jgi:hypothetical protein
MICRMSRLLRSESMAAGGAGAGAGLRRRGAARRAQQPRRGVRGAQAARLRERPL